MTCLVSLSKKWPLLILKANLAISPGLWGSLASAFEVNSVKPVSVQSIVSAPSNSGTATLDLAAVSGEASRATYPLWMSSGRIPKITSLPP